LALPAEVFIALMISGIRGCHFKVALSSLLLTRQHPNRESVPIPESLLRQLTGHSKTQVSDSLNLLVEEGVVSRTKPFTAYTPGEYAFNKDFEHWGKFKVDRLNVLALLRPAKAPDGAVKEATGEFAPPDSYTTILQSEEAISSSQIEDGLNEEETGAVARPTTQQILGYAVGFSKVPLFDYFKGVLAGQIKKLLQAGEDPEFIKEAARRLVMRHNNARDVKPEYLPGLFNAVKGERKDWPESGGSITWDGRQAPEKTLEELVLEADKLEADKLEARPLTAEELLAQLENPDT
jgi:hypothetical protein